MEVMDNQQKPKKVRGCSKCKKKKEITKLDIIPVNVEELLMPSEEEIKLAYYELTNMKGVQEDKKGFISFVYKSIFKEDFDWSCTGCAHTQVRKFEAYCNKNQIKL